MERRTLIAFILIGLITFAWMWSAQTSQRQRAQQTRPAASGEAPATPPAPSSPAAPAAPAPAAPGAAAESVISPSPAAALRGDIFMGGSGMLVTSAWTNHGASLQEARLVRYAETLKSSEGVQLLGPVDDKLATFTLQDMAGNEPLDTRNYQVVAELRDRVAFASTFSNGLRVTKEFTEIPGRYELGVRITLENVGHAPIKTQYRLFADARIVPEAVTDPEMHGLIGWLDKNGADRLLEVTPANVHKQPKIQYNSQEMPILWAGAANRYFAAVLRPVPPQGANSFASVYSADVDFLQQSEATTSQWGNAGKSDNLTVALVSTGRTLEPGKSLTDEYTYFIGPKEQKVLAAYPDMAGILDYGFFGFVSKFLVWVLKSVYAVIPNYGVGIILLTILIKVCLFPMTRKGQISMHRMQRLQPQIKELQEKHKDDRQRQGREMMELYKRHNANPMSGCWPMLVQIPIFWGLFQMLKYAIELRHQGFAGWIRDLSQPDTIAVVHGFPVNILPVLMVISWFFQQWTMPKPADPQQAQTQKMMMFMPIIFGFMLYGMASGLTLYWLTSTFLGILEQRLIKHQIKHMEATGAFAAAEVIEAPAKTLPRGQRPPKRK